MAKRADGAGTVRHDGYVSVRIATRAHLVHRLVAERALGRPLPPRAVVHHVDGNPNNNAPSNLVICPDTAYHRLLHRRQDALNACGDANAVRCIFCGIHAPVADLRRRSPSNSYCHAECLKQRNAVYHATVRKIRRRAYS